MHNWMSGYINGLSAAEYHLQITLLFLLMVFFLYKIYTTFHSFRFISDTATSKIASAAQGYVELKGLGELLPGPAITTVFSQRRCVWYQCIIERKKTVQKKSYWIEESNEISDHLFMLEDETGQCIVIPDAAQVIPSEVNIWYGNSLQPQNSSKVNFKWFNRFIGFGHYRFSEKLITVASPLYVIGLFKSIEKDSHNESQPETVGTLPKQYLKDFDLNKNDKIQQPEFGLIRQTAVKEMREFQQQTKLHTIQNTDEKNQPFIISALSERKLLTKKMRMMMVYLTLFFILLYLSLSAISVYR